MNRIRFFSLIALCLYSSALLAQQVRELQVVVGSPKGPTQTIDQSQTIFVSFNQPMVPLKEVPQDEGSGPMLIEPTIPGKYRWMGTTTFAILPADTLPNATGFTVRVPAGTKSLSGQTLAKDYMWQFETPRPRVLRTIPYNQQRFVELDHSMYLFFNQRVNPQTTTKFISVEERKGADLKYPSYDARYPTSEELKLHHINFQREQGIVLVPRQKFRKGAAITIRCKTGLVGSEGPLGMATDFSFAFSTYNEFEFINVKNEDHFPPSHALVLVFSNPVSIKEVAKHLVLDPPVKFSEEMMEYDYTTEEMHLQLPLQPETSYRGSFKKGLKDRFDQELQEGTTFMFRTGSFKPYARMTTGPGVVEAYESHRYPVRLMNIDSVLVQMGKVDFNGIVPLMQRMTYDYYQRLAWEEGILEWMDIHREGTQQFTSSSTWRLKLPKNKETTKPIELDEVLGKSSLGVILLQVDNLLPDEHRRYLKALLQVTHLGITAKFSPEDNLIWVTNLKDAMPIAGATVEVRNDSNQVLWTGTTDRNGLAKSPGWGKLGMAGNRDEGEEGEEWEGDWYSTRQPRQWVLVKYNDDVAFTNSQWNQGIEPWIFNVAYDWDPKFEEVHGSLFTDRGLYKANESVEIKGVVRIRREGAWKIPKQMPLELVVRNSRNEEILKTEPVLNTFGSFSLQVPLKPAAPLGYYSLTLTKKRPVKEGINRPRSRTGGEHLASGSFRVEAFRAAEFEVTAQTEKKSYIIGDTLNGFVSARYLFGAPMKQEPVAWRISTSQSGWWHEGYDGYFFSPMRWLSNYTRGYGHTLLQSGQGMLDDGGSFRVSSVLRVGELRGTSSLLLEGDVTSPSRQVISGRTSVTVHGGEYYIGVAPSSTFIKSDSLLTYKLITLTPEGKPVAEKALTVKIIQRIWRSVRKAETGGRYVWISEPESIMVDSVVVKSGESPVERSFRTKQAGFYYIEASGKDARGNAILSHAYFYVSGSSYVAWERTNDDRIELVVNKTNFKPGETASIIVKSPYEEATALVSIEREGIIQHYTTTLKGSAPQIDIPIQKSFLPNVYVSVVLLQGRVEAPGKSKESDVGRPSFKIGYVNLSVSPKEKQLTLNVSTDKKEYRPGDSVHVTLSVKNSEGIGVASEVAVSIADLGVLNLIGYRMPDLFTQFYAERGLAVTTTETRIHLVQQRDYGEKGEDEGGGGAAEKMLAAMDAEGIRKDFRPSAYWNPSIVTNTQGNATVAFKLPDNLTSFQIMAVGQTMESDFGYGENSFIVNKPLLMLPSLPRFARVGDSFEGGTVIFNYSDKETKVHLVTEVHGIRFEGQDTAYHVLKPGQAYEVRHKFVAERVGKATLTFRAQTDDDRDGLQWTIPIYVPRMRESVALYESTTDPQKSEKFITPKEVYKELGEVELTAASTAMVGLSGGMSYLFHYPYGCLEQRVSAILPIILAKDLVEAFKFEVFKNKDYRQVVTKTLDELPAFQRSNGGFAYWKNEQRTDPYVSAYAMYALIQAQRNGYTVDKQQINTGLEYLKRVLRNEERAWYYTPLIDNCTKSFILYTLALAGQPDYGYMEKIYREEKLSPNENVRLPLFGKAYLLKALRTANGNVGMIADLARDLTNQAKVAPTSAHFEERYADGMEWIFHSTARTTALTMQALVETQPENPLIPKIVRWLLDEQKNGCWRTTQENWYVVDALVTYFRAYEKEEPNFRAQIWLAGGAALNELFQGRSLKTELRRVPMIELASGVEYPIDIKKDGTGRMYYGIRMNYYPKGETKLQEEGLSVLKTFEPIKEALPKSGAFKAGMNVKVTLTVVTNQDRNYVVVEDPLPAGFEAVNSSFLTSARNLAEEEQATSGENRWWTWNPFNHKEMYDDRVLLFADYLPAGVHTFTYLARVTNFGNFQMPSTRAEGMYEPEVFGQTSSKQVRVE